MLSGIWPRGSSSAPGSGNTGTISGSSPGPRYSALIGIGSPGQFIGSARSLFTQPRPARAGYGSREKNRRQPPASVDGRLVGAAPGLEELYQLLAGAVIVPLAVAPDDFQKLVGRF